MIVNGEPGTRAQLHRLCADRPDLQVIAEAASGHQAIDVLEEGAADLLLVDSRLPDMTGFELLRAVPPEAAPATIMLTAAREEAARELPGIHVRYLYKPVEPPQFNAAVDLSIPRPVSEPDVHWPQQIIGERSSRIYFLDVHDVEYLASAGNYVTTHLGSDQFLTRATLKSMADMLTPLGFIQIARSLLINVRQIAHVERRDRGQYCFVTRTGHRLVSSRERGGDLRELLLGAMSPHRR